MISKRSVYILLMILSTQSYMFAMEDAEKISENEKQILRCMKDYFGNQENGVEGDWSMLSLKNKGELRDVHYKDIINIMVDQIKFTDFMRYTNLNFLVRQEINNADLYIKMFLSDANIGKMLYQLSTYVKEKKLFNKNGNWIEDQEKLTIAFKLSELAIEKYTAAVEQ